ncbi:glycosyltransferase family 4 protein [Actibacterium sp. D379-3]
MPGAGTKPDITTNRPPAARLLDVSRLVSRAGRGPLTGVDRVEMAYLTRLLAESVPLFALARTALGFVLLDRAGAAALAARLSGRAAWGRADLLARLSYRRGPMRGRAEADLRRLALARCRRAGLARMLARHLPPDTACLNVGHSNLSMATLTAMRALPDARIAVLIHDTIPLDFPQYSGAGIPDAFAARLRAVSAHADLVICNSQATRADVARHMAGYGRVPDLVVAHLGVDRPVPDPAALPPGLDLSGPYFVTVGTIEPRKNHALLLDVWQAMLADRPEAEVPRLFIAGTRGWRNAALFHRLDTAPFMNRTVFELPGLDDDALAALMQGACALLFPSHAEGYGLPPLEAAALGVPVLANDLPVYHEVLGELAVYARGPDAYSWKKNIEGLMRDAGITGKDGRTAARSAAVPAWTDHFNTVLSLT